jgi:septal ring factor EnvC (AmiA/AmiB activator)
LQLRRELDEVSSELDRTKRGLTKIAEAFGEGGFEVSLEDFFERLAATANALRHQVQRSSADLMAKDRDITSLNSQLKLLSKEAGLFSYKADLENRTPLTEALNRKHS